MVKKFVVEFDNGTFLKHAATIPNQYWNRNDGFPYSKATPNINLARLFTTKGAATNATAGGKHGAKVREVLVTVEFA